MTGWAPTSRRSPTRTPTPPGGPASGRRRRRRRHQLPAAVEHPPEEVVVPGLGLLQVDGAVLVEVADVVGPEPVEDRDGQHAGVEDVGEVEAVVAGRGDAVRLDAVHE